MLHSLMFEKKYHLKPEHLEQQKCHSVAAIQWTVIFCFEQPRCDKLTAWYDHDDAGPARRVANAIHSSSTASRTGFHSAVKSQLPSAGANYGLCDPVTLDEIISGGRRAYAACGACDGDVNPRSAVEVAVITTKVNYLSTWSTATIVIQSCFPASTFLVHCSELFGFRLRC